MATGKTQFQTITVASGKSASIIKAQENWYWVTLVRITSGAVTIANADGSASGMPLGSIPVTLPISPGTEVYAYSPTDDEVGVSIVPMPPGMTDSLVYLASVLQAMLAPQTISTTTPIKRDLIDELNMIKKRR